MVSFWFVTLVDIGASAVGAWRKPDGAIALETTDDVLASPVAANPGFRSAFVRVDARFAGRIESVADRTFAPE